MRQEIIQGKKERIKAFDVLKFWAIALLPYIHCIQYLLSSYVYNEPVYRIIYSFHMPLFIMISGYFAVGSMKLPTGLFLKKKLLALYLPVFSWTIIYAIINIGPQLYDSGDINLCIKQGLKFIYGPYPFWFLRTLFACYCLSYIGNKLKINKAIWIPITIIASQFIPYFPRIDQMYPCFIIGMMLKDYPKFYNTTCKNWIYLLGIFILMLLFFDQFFWGHDGIIKSFIVNQLQINSHTLQKAIAKTYQLIIGIIGSLAFIGAFCALTPQDKNSKIVSICNEWGKHTLGIYILQTFILEILMAKFINLDGVNTFVFHIILAPSISIIILLICIYITKTIYKSRLLSFISFGHSK